MSLSGSFRSFQYWTYTLLENFQSFFLFGWFCLFLILLNFCKFDTVRVCYTTLGFAQVHKNVETRSAGKIFPCYTSAFIKDNISQDLSSLGDCVCGDLL